MYKLLLVDDEAIIREGIERMIDWKRLGIELTGSVSNAPAALESMTDEMPDILMTDVRMPGMDGLELIERAMTLRPQLRCVILSGYDEFDYARRALRAGAVEYLLKPCAQEEMERSLRSACESIAQERAQQEESFEARQQRVRRLAAQMRVLQPGGGRTDIEERQIRELEAYDGDKSVLRDALIETVTHSAMSMAHVEWGFSVVQKAYEEEDSLEELAARTLTRMQGGQENRRAFVKQMMDYVNEHFDSESLSLQYIADEVVYMSADYIGKEFAKEAGMKFSAYLLAVRMNHAKALMASDAQLPTYEIAEQVGLGNNPHYFSQLFRKYTGLTPKEYKNTAKFRGKTEN